MANQRPTRLTFIGASENVPREIRGAGKACGGDFAIVMVPARMESRVTLLVKREARIGVWSPTGVTTTDHPHQPAIAATPTEAKAFLAAGRDVSKAGASTLKGAWAGTVMCSAEHGPQFRFERKIGYVKVIIETEVSRGMVGWSVHVERQKQWFGVDSVSAKVHKVTLRGAMITGADLAVDSAREVCAANVTTRRAAVDAAYGAAHPAPEPRVQKDPIEKMNAALDKIPLLKKEPAAPVTRGRAKAPAHPVGSAGELAAAQATATAAASAAVVAIDAATADPSKAKGAAEAASQALRTAGAVAVHPLAQSAAAVADDVTDAAGHLAPVLQRAMKVGDWKKLREAITKVGTSAEGAARRAQAQRRSPSATPAPASRPVAPRPVAAPTRPAARPAPTPAAPASPPPRAARAKPAGRSDAEKDAAIMKLITDALRDNIR